MRPKRKGKNWKQLRCYAALIVEWLKIAYRYGYLKGTRRSKTAKEPYLRAYEAGTHRFRNQLRDLYMCPPSRRHTHEELERAAKLEARRLTGRRRRRTSSTDPPS